MIFIKARSALMRLFATMLLLMGMISVSAQDQTTDGENQDGATMLLPSLLKENPDVSIFYEALLATHLSDTLQMYVDAEYPGVTYDSTMECLVTTGRVAVEYETPYETGNSRQRAVWPDKRLFKFTVFVVNNSVLKEAYGIRSLGDLITKAKEVYPDPAHINDDLWLSTSPLYKLISYHILPCWLPYDQLNISQKVIIDNRKQRDSLDVEDFYETLHPYAIMRISTPLDAKVEKKGIYINRKGTVSADNLENNGVRIWSPGEKSGINQIALNGGYHYVDSLLLFNQETKNALHTRMRVMFSTLSPDFINSGARGRLRTDARRPVDYAVYGFKKGFCKNVNWSGPTEFYVRYRDATFGCLYGDEITCRGYYDITFRLPPVPESGVYEIRMHCNFLGISSNNDRGIVLFYTGKDNYNLIPCSVPFNMGMQSQSITDPQIGAIMDKSFWHDYSTEEEVEAAIADNDKLMRQNGFMKEPDIYGPGSNNLRDNSCDCRKIVCEQYMESG
ncbi:MAG: hypothetical protein ACSW76_03675, partial [Bacteroidaceae bacterium]